MKRLTKTVKFRLTESERDRLQTMADSTGATVSDVVRHQLHLDETLKKPRQPKLRTRQADPELVRSVAWIGNNLNQIARWVNTHKSDADAVQVISELSALHTELSRLIKPVPTVTKEDEEGGDAH